MSADAWRRRIGGRVDKKKVENNPMHSSRPPAGIALFQIFDFYEIELTRRAKQAHDVIMPGGTRASPAETSSRWRKATV
ncbi:hypothetical protein [Bradyrhizobium commune]|uniref:Uncharacterized protein n=1 Tax=Bradyrhizobium commune TaxID=83627 RepID=A0A7S9D6R0_9BRAD|nr:hypothetical protein [Bradyrhizobium commune]QPF92237.1 hypothetical protein IC761_02735 [Bradyrhizobium commune]